MAGSIGSGVAAVLVALGVAAASGADEVALRESVAEGATSRVVVTLKADGLFREGPPPGAAHEKTEKAKPIKPLALRVETRLDAVERVVKRDPDGRARRVARRVLQAASAVNGEIRPSGAVLRPEVALMVADRRDEGVVVYSPSGPLTRSELEVVQGVGDPLALAALLPDRPVAPGATWKVGAEGVRALTGYDALAVNGLEAQLDELDEARARIKLTGTVRGAVQGGEGSIACDGSLVFDRKADRVERLSLNRTETRQAGAVEAGLEIKSTLTVTREAAETPPELADAALAALPLDPAPEREELLLIAPNGKYTLRHDRDWHITWDDRRQTVLKRLDRGNVIAQCNLAVGPNAGKGRHQDLNQFRDDIKRALGTRFGQVIGDGEIEGDPAGGFRYKVGVQGKEGEVGVLWNYYLIAGPEGDQVLAIFTLATNQSKAFGDQDLQIVGSFRWTGQ